MSPEIVTAAAGVVLAIVLIGAILVMQRRGRDRFGDDAHTRSQRNEHERKRQLLIDIISAPNTVARTPETLQLVKSVVIVHKRAYREDTEVFITTPCGINQEVYAQHPEHSGQQVYDRVVRTFNYWANEMADNEMIGSMIKQQKLGDVL